MSDPKSGLTRRQLAAGAAVLVPAFAQEQVKEAGELGPAREQAKRNAAALRKFSLPMLAEPAFVFKP